MRDNLDDLSTEGSDDLPDDDPEVVERMGRLGELRASESGVPEIPPTGVHPHEAGSLAQAYRDAGVEPPWTLNWNDGKVVPRGEGGILDMYDENGKWVGPKSRR